VLFIGDSITLADYLEDDETIPSMFQNLASLNGIPVRSINAGIATAGTNREAEMLKEAIARETPALVVVNFFLNDARNCCAIRSTTLPAMLNRSTFLSKLFEGIEYLQNPTVNYERDLSPEQFLSWRVSAERRLRERPMSPQFRQIAIDRFVGWGNMWSDEAWERMRKDILDMVESAKRKGITIAFVAYPVTSQISIDSADTFPQLELKRILDSVNVKVLDLLPTFRTLFIGEKKLPFYDEGHPTAEGNMIIAREINRFIRDNRLLSSLQ
jgi:lysophospholipase L1-like esterase